MNKFVVGDFFVLLGGRTIQEIDEMFSGITSNLPQNLKEAVVHECGHAKAYYRRSAQEIFEMNEELKSKGVSGISKITYNDDAECLAELEVLKHRGVDVSTETKTFYKKYMGREYN